MSTTFSPSYQTAVENEDIINDSHYQSRTETNLQNHYDYSDNSKPPTWLVDHSSFGTAGKSRHLAGLVVY